MILRSWAVDAEAASRRLVRYYDHTREWWDAAIFYYNQQTGARVPNSLFHVAGRYRFGQYDPAQARHYDFLALEVLAYWETHKSVANLLLPDA